MINKANLKDYRLIELLENNFIFDEKDKEEINSFICTYNNGGILLNILFHISDKIKSSFNKSTQIKLQLVGEDYRYGSILEVFIKTPVFEDSIKFDSLEDELYEIYAVHDLSKIFLSLEF